MQHKKLISDFSVDSGQRSFVATITSNSVDRDREVLLPEGMNSKDFERNPVVFWNHDSNIPIGKAVALKRKGPTWTAKATLATRPENHEGEWFPDTVLSLMQQGVVKGISVGLIPEPGHVRKPTPKDKEMFGNNITNVVSRWNLLEFSVTPLPANQDALVSAVSKGLLTRNTANKMFGMDLTVKTRAQEDQPIKLPQINVIKGAKRKPGIDVDVAISEAVKRAQSRRLGKIYLTPEIVLL